MPLAGSFFASCQTSTFASRAPRLLEQLGEDGWEAIGPITITNSSTAFVNTLLLLKRPKVTS